MDLFQNVDVLKRNGFVNMGPSVLSKRETEELCALSRQIFDSLPHDHPDRIPGETGVQGVMRLPQQHPRIAQLINRIVTDASVKAVLLSVLGPNYKIWQINLRRSGPGDKGLYLHQDAHGETGLCVLLSENRKGSGATVFLPGSHREPSRMKKWKVELPPIILMNLRFLFAPLTGTAGDIAFFFNRTWHGRFSNQSKDTHDVILMAFFPAGASFGSSGYYGEWSQDFLSSNRETELGRLINPEIGTERQIDGRFRILAESSDIPYSLVIEDSPRVPLTIRTRLSIVLLRIVMGLGRPMARMLRFIGLLEKAK